MPHGQGRGAGNKSLCLGKREKKEPKSPGVYGREHGDRGARGGGCGGNWERRGPTGSQHTQLHGSLAMPVDHSIAGGEEFLFLASWGQHSMDTCLPTTY